MNDRELRRLAAELVDEMERGRAGANGRGEYRQPVSRYLDPKRFELERQGLFRDHPLIVAHHSELSEPGVALTRNIAGRSIILTRDLSGEVHALLNSCLHRGMQLLEGEAPRCARKLICPYHSWTYALDGQLTGLPHAVAFPDLDPSAASLQRLRIDQRHGFIWVWPRPEVQGPGLDEWLGSLNLDFQHFELSEHLLFDQSVTEARANWKLLVDAFLEAYHVRILHRKTVGPFFRDAVAVSNTDGPHTRSAVARNELEPGPAPDLREQMTFTHFVFPNQVFVFHPDYVSQMSILPLAADRLQFHHRMLVPADQFERREHWQRSFKLIDEGVFRSEDLKAAERNQRGLESTFAETVRFGHLESLLQHFHVAVDGMLEAGDNPAVRVSSPAAINTRS